MRHGFVAWTPLHVINMLNVQASFINDDDQIIFFIYDDFAGSNELILSIPNYFPHIEIVKIEPQEFGNKVTKLSRLFTNNNPFYKKEISEIYLPGDNYYGRILFSSQFKKNKDVKLNYVEDGMGAYVGMDIIHSRNINDRLQKTFNKHSIYFGKWQSSYVYEPDLLNKNMISHLVTLPKLKPDNPVFDSLHKLFSDIYKEDTDEIIEGAVLYLDQPFQTDGIKVNEMGIFEALKKMCKEINLPLQVKMHPRSKEDKYGTDVEYFKTTIPWEVYILLYGNRNFTLMGINSTAAFSPLLMFSEKLPVVLLSEYVSNFHTNHQDDWTSYSIKESVRFTQKMQSEFENFLKLPKNEQEISDILFAIKNSRDEEIQL